MPELEELYRAPATPQPARASGIRGTSLKWVYASIALTGTACSLVAGDVGSKDVALLLRGAGITAMLVAPIIGLVWLHRSWSDVPLEDRFQTELGRISAGTAIGRLVMPFYNVYWGFAVHRHLADAISASLRKRGIGLSAEPQLAYAALGATMLSRVVLTMKEPAFALLVVAVAELLWFSYMSRCDTFRRMMLLAWQAEREAGRTRRG